jgi:hypothetical protein
MSNEAEPSAVRELKIFLDITAILGFIYGAIRVPGMSALDLKDSPFLSSLKIMFWGTLHAALAILCGFVDAPLSHIVVSSVLAFSIYKHLTDK